MNNAVFGKATGNVKNTQGYYICNNRNIINNRDYKNNIDYKHCLEVNQLENKIYHLETNNLNANNS